MSGLVEIMDAMEAKITAAVASAPWPIQVRGRQLLVPTPPSIDMYPGQPTREDTFAAFGDLMGALVFTVRARVISADNEAGQELLLSFMDDEHDLCIAAALEVDQTLNGLVASVDVNALTGFIPYVDVDSAGQLLGCEWQVLVVNATS